MPTLEDALILAAEAHRGMTDKADAAYILHPIRVMLRLSTEAERIVGLLHDVVEDSDWTLDRLRDAGYSEDIVAAVDYMTRREDETYEDFILRCKANPIARAVKAADIADNMDMSRIPTPTDKDRQRLDRYRKAKAVLEG